MDRSAVLQAGKSAGLNTVLVVDEHFLYQLRDPCLTIPRRIQAAPPDQFSHFLLDDGERSLGHG
jgi:hypothetical protein